ncbi:PhzF-like isomerase [Zymomonas mobilis subsp. mobilis ZM4 = ATCC 31821]|uniref:Phenazine biosynthesis protein PhzF family n=1 Tax=Zymomonas mobilis subsp. mobilis (strain ATCC 31821 / ZM4 / CP4) TaxID=264203 RepID=Q5NL41_ZYMMO|nr:PhzF family phenazine biosynthesis protein [Zymomonas mobilis]AAV90569.1 phenazine biosynthesis protein PhzF family [Zymomonas mobilis subsp. mobilis ZM4 = ATCC 31821]AVZ26745.1 PhzF-like isomerase [Zymomonas mobilis subsp. mobilis]AVZ28631.1 PhzF-like isomerase [Zymomonas mobilis subsp. mobilis]AVZ43077.1 PhzF-like isomerase [Zymomonas mobilis subsp. mobilis ZM4 = ATCC 31821]UBQ07825.1 PhzF family phenazine biosynthesis protein [Zymomonas mobilis]
MPLDFVQVDAFTHRSLYGNPAAVVFDADEIPAETMQKIAREMNLSETVFILKPTTPDADYRARIFTPMSEMPFAGHPTVAAAHSVLARYPDKANATLLRQECGIGIVPVEVIPSEAGTLLRMTQGAPKYRDSGLSRETVAKMLGCAESDLADSPFEVVSTGVPWLIVELSRFEAISTLNPDQGLTARECKALKACGVTVFVERGDGGPVRIRVRTFAPGEGVAEDPVCGSGNGSVAAYIAHHKHAGDPAGSYIAEQGIEIGRDGEIHASWERDGENLRVRIGGQAAVSASGQLHL